MGGVAEMASAVLLECVQGQKSGFEAFAFRNFPEEQGTFVARGWQDDRGSAHVRFQGSPDLSEHYLRYIPQVAAKLLSANNLTSADVAVMLGPQIGLPFTERLAHALGIPTELAISAETHGQDLFTSSLPCVMRGAEDRVIADAADVGLVIAASPGISVGCAIYRF